MAIEENRLRNERLLEQLVQQGAQRNNECNTLTEFLRSQPPTFSEAEIRLMRMTGCVLLSASLWPCMFRWRNK